MSGPHAFARTGTINPVGATPVFQVQRGERHGGTPVLFLHGIPTWSWLWRNVIEETAREYRSIAVDLPGFGMSDKSGRHSFRVPALGETIDQLLDDVVGPERPVHLVVHDFGALVGAELIARSRRTYPSLIVTNTSMRHDAWTGGGPLRILSVPYLGDLSMMLARPWMLRMAMYPYVADPAARTPERVAGYWYPFEHGFGRSLARLFRERAVEADDFDRWRAALQAYTGGSFIIWGERDPTFTPREMHDIHGLLPGANVLSFENACHFLPEERPEAVGRAIRSFISSRID